MDTSHMVLAHQHMAHLIDHPRLKESILVNARIRAVFGGLSTRSACDLAEEMCLSELNERQIKKALYHTIHVYKEETRTIYSEGKSESSTDIESEMSGSGSTNATASGSGVGGNEMQAYMMPVTPGLGGTEGWFVTEGTGTSGFTSEGSSLATSEFSSHGTSHAEGRASQHGKTTVPVWVPIPVKELSQEEDWSLEEKRLKLAEMLKHQAERHCFINLDQPRSTQPLCVPYVNTPHISANRFDEYERAICKKQGSIKADEVDRLLIASESEFMARARTPPSPDGSRSGNDHADDDENLFE